MVTEFDYPAWIVLVMGLYALGAGLGELFKPGMWMSMVDDIEAHPALQFLTGIVCMAIGTALYLIAPWDDGSGRADWMLYAVKIIGAWMIIEGFIFLAFGSWLMRISKRMIGWNTKLWAILSALFGIAAWITAEFRISDTL
jgi:uncharacterized protein YjeT (DUF2065 family)